MDGSDEDPLICEDNKFFTIICSVFLIILLIILILPSIWRNCRQVKADIDNVQLVHQEDFETLLMQYEHNHHDKDIIQQVNEILLKISYYETLKSKRVFGQFIYDFEARFHKDDEKEFFNCLNSNLNKFSGLVSLILDHHPSMFDKIRDYMFSKWQVKVVSMMKWLKGVQNVYIDTVKDIHVCIILILIAGGPERIHENPQEFPSVLAISFSLTIIIPALISSIHLCISNPDLIFKTYGVAPLCKRVFMRIGIICLSILNPIILINKYESMNDRLKNDLQKRGKIETNIYEKLNTLRRVWLEFFKIELFLELFPQVALQVIILLLTNTETGTVYLPGLNAITSSTFFGIKFSPEVFLGISIFWSTKSCILLQIKSISVEKGFMPAMTQIIVTFYATFGTIRRILAIVMFFVPSFGLFSILHHWQEEQIPFKIRFEFPDKTKPNDPIALYNISDPIFWGDYDRWNLTDLENPKAPPYEIYTGLSLAHTFFAFIGLSIFHFICILLVKISKGTDFKRKKKLFAKFRETLKVKNRIALDIYLEI